MAALGFLFFVGVVTASVWAIVATVGPRRSYIAALLSHSSAASVLMPVAQRRRVRRINPAPARPVFVPVRAAA